MALPFSFLRDVIGLGLRPEIQRLWDSSKVRLEALAPMIERKAREHGVSPALVAGIIVRESGARPEAIGPEFNASGDTAQGLMQVIPSNLERLGIPRSQWHDPEVNVEAGLQILTGPPTPYGKEDTDSVLADYGGFETEDPSEYIRDIYGLATSSVRELGIRAMP